MHGRNKLPVIVGGTNYYIESLLWRVLVDTGVSATTHIHLPSSRLISYYLKDLKVGV